MKLRVGMMEEMETRASRWEYLGQSGDNLIHVVTRKRVRDRGIWRKHNLTLEESAERP